LKHVRLAALLAALGGWAAACTGCAAAPAEQRLIRNLMREQLWLEAEARLLHELERQPDSAAVHNDLAVCYEALGRTDLALRHYQRALELAPSDAIIRANLEAARRLAQSRASGGAP
jgi:Flp pilus assembly protein TadD